MIEAPIPDFSKNYKQYINFLSSNPRTSRTTLFNMGMIDYKQLTNSMTSPYGHNSFSNSLS